MKAISTENYILGAYFGALGVMMLFNLFLYFSVRDHSYLFYVVYIAMFALAMLSVNGLAFQFLWPSAPAFSNGSLPLFLFGSASSVAFFSTSFLKTRQLAPRLHALLNSLAYACAAAALASPLLAGRVWLIIFNLSTFVIIPIILLMGFLSLQSGYAPARYFLFAWVGFLAGILINALRTLGVLPVNAFTSYAMLCGSAVEVVLLSLALGARIKTIRQERADAQVLALTNIQRADRLQDELLSNVSHELNTPLASILAHTEMLQNGDWAQDQLADVYKTIRKDSAHLSRQVGNLMLVTKISTQTLSSALETCELGRVFSQTRDAVAMEYPDRTIDFDQCSIQMRTDRALLQAAMHEVVLNGVVYAGPGAVVRLTAEQQGEQIRIVVLDNGPGIPDHAIDIVTGRFARMDKGITYRESGIGMGLFLAVRLTEILGGNLSLENDSAGGLRATFLFPATGLN